MEDATAKSPTARKSIESALQKEWDEVRHVNVNHVKIKINSKYLTIKGKFVLAEIQ